MQCFVLALQNRYPRMREVVLRLLTWPGHPDLTTFTSRFPKASVAPREEGIRMSNMRRRSRVSESLKRVALQRTSCMLFVFTTVLRLGN